MSIFSRTAFDRAIEGKRVLACWLIIAAGLFAFPSLNLGAVIETIHSIGIPPAHPIGELIESADGVFYGTTSAGGAFDAGTIFKLTAGGVLSTVIEFTVSGEINRGAVPGAALIAGPGGALYGTTAKGGAYGVGTIFRLGLDGVLTTLVEFSGNGASNQGASPYAPLLLADDGLFYGTTADGGASGNGTIFKMNIYGELDTLVEFTGNGKANKGEAPYGGLVQLADHFFYGTTSKGGAKGSGTIFKMNRSGVLTTLVEFTDNGALNKGANPYAGLARGADGNLYGTTAKGGVKGNGTAFKVTPAGVLSTLAHFDGKGALPESMLVPGSDGAFYGTTFGGGLHKLGTVFKLAADGTLQVLVDFTGKIGPSKGSIAQSALVLGKDGFLYGTTFNGGLYDGGTIFKLTTAGILSTVAELQSATPASNPQPGLVVGADGNFYGAIAGGGIGGLGTLFRLTSAGEYSTLAEFTGNGQVNKGSAPMAALNRGINGTLYGTTSSGGSGDFGTVFKLAADGTISTLAEFSGNGAANKGAAPMASLVQDSSGILYGTTSKGGAADMGTVFRLTPAGTLTTLAEFSGNGAVNKGASPHGALVEGGDGNFYGTTLLGGAKNLGTIFRITPNGALVTLAEFADAEPGKQGAYPYGALLPGNGGVFYGTTSTGGVKGNGTLFKLLADGTLSTLFEFDKGRAPGSYPQGALALGLDGSMYGVTTFGGAPGSGTLFKVSSNGAFSTLAEFSDGGAYPESGVIIGSDGNLYGTTSEGGESGAGSIFRLRIRALPITGKPGGVQSESARLNAVIEPGSLAAIAAFEFGFTAEYGSVTENKPVENGLTLAMSLSGLLPNTTYHYRALVADIGGTVVGEDQTFTTGPMPFTAFTSGALIAGSQIAGFGVPAIDEDAGIAVLASLVSSKGKETAILAGSPAVIVARKSQLAPLPDGSTSPTRRFVSFSDPVCGQAGRVAFVAAILDGTRPRTGLWSNGSGQLKEVAIAGGAVEGVAGAQFKTFSSVAMSAPGTIFYVGSFSGGASGRGGLGAWACDAAGSHLLVRQGAPLLQSTVSSFNALGAVAGSPGQGRGYYDSTLSALVNLADRKQAVVHFTIGAPAQVVLASGDEVPYHSPQNRLVGFGVPSVSQDGAAAFLARLTKDVGGVTKLSDQAIFADQPGVNLIEIIRKGALAPGADQAVFATLADPVYNAQSGVAFLGTLSGAGVTPKNAAGIWWTAPEGLGLVARAGDEAAGVAGSTWSAFSSLVLPNASGPVFVAKLAADTGGTALPNGVNASNNIGVWAVDPTGNVRLIVRTGDQVNVEGAPKTIALLTVLGPVLGSPGQGRAYSSNRQLACRAAFTDRSQAILRFYLP